MLASDPATSKAQSKQDMPEGLKFGLPNYWYPILESHQLGDKPTCIERFGEKLAVWRDKDGRAAVFHNHCPHRRAPLSLGSVHGEELVCAYHGWRFNRNGDCVEKPLEEPDAAVNERHAVKSYAAEDRAGYIWMFYGERSKATPLRVPPELEDENWYPFKAEYVWETNWLNVLDNVLDPLHAIYLHSGAVTQRRRAKFKSFRITNDNEQGFRLGKMGYLPDGSIGPVEGEVEFEFPNIVRLDIADGSQAGLYRVIIMPTPHNADRVAAFYVRARKATGWARLKWWLWWARHGRSVHSVAAEDRDVMAGLGPIEEARRTENLALSDTGVVRLRRRLSQAYRDAQER
jgi:phenylpropionate dioxygenase-like ring-hydroxylating dioxygenase large terminal subunit